MIWKKRQLKKSGIYLITDSQVLQGRDIYRLISLALAAGVDMIQFRDYKLNDREFIKTAKRIKTLTEKRSAIFMVNDRIDLALAVDSDGVHLGQNDMPVHIARKLLGNKKILGISTHSLSQIKEATKKDVDYISVGPVFSTPIKPDCKPTGLELVKKAKEKLKIPFVAIGGIDESNIRDVVRAGAKRIGVVRAILASKEPFLAAKNLIKGLCENGTD